MDLSRGLELFPAASDPRESKVETASFLKSCCVCFLIFYVLHRLALFNGDRDLNRDMKSGVKNYWGSLERLVTTVCALASDDSHPHPCKIQSPFDKVLKSFS